MRILVCWVEFSITVLSVVTLWKIHHRTVNIILINLKKEEFSLKAKVSSPK